MKGNSVLIVGIILILAGMAPDPIPVVDEIICYGGGILSLLSGIRKLLRAS